MTLSNEACDAPWRPTLLDPPTRSDLFVLAVTPRRVDIVRGDTVRAAPRLYRWWMPLPAPPVPAEGNV